MIAKLFEIKVKKYEDKSKIVQKYIHELFLFIKKATHDNIISPEEIIEYQNILKEFDREINNIKEDSKKEIKTTVDSIPKNLDREKLEQILQALISLKGTGT